MARQTVPFLSFNRGLISPKALARVDLDRTRLSAEVYRNFICKTQGALTIRPGTKYMGSSLNDTGAEYLEFVAATDDVALVELTHQKMRLWIGTDAHNLSLLGRPAVDTTVSLSDTGWSNTSIGGSVTSGSSADVIPDMTGPTTNGVTVTASSEDKSSSFGGDAWHAADDATTTHWSDTGFGHSALPSWWNVDFGSDTGNRKAVRSYSIRAGNDSRDLDQAPSTWRLLTGNHDTGTFATDTGKWALVDERSGETAWAVSEKRTFTRPDADTGTVEVQRHYRLHVTDIDGSPSELVISEIEMFTAGSAAQVQLQGGHMFLNAAAAGALAKAPRLH